MQNILQLSKREEMSSLQLEQLRKDGFVPGVIYGGGIKEDGSGEIFQVSYLDLEKLMRQGCFFNTVIEVELNGKKHKVLPRAAQSHVVTDRVLHVEFQKVSDSDKIDVSIPYFIVGADQSEAMKRGAVVHKVFKGLKIRCKAGAIPKAVKLDVSALKVGGFIKVKSLSFPKDVQILHKPDLTILKITGKKDKNAVAETEEAAA